MTTTKSLCCSRRTAEGRAVLDEAGEVDMVLP